LTWPSVGEQVVVINDVGNRFANSLLVLSKELHIICGKQVGRTDAELAMVFEMEATPTFLQDKQPLNDSPLSNESTPKRHEFRRRHRRFLPTGST
jgi:hypothetical protein